jgi:hypothetical protein
MVIQNASGGKRAFLITGAIQFLPQGMITGSQFTFSTTTLCTVAQCGFSDSVTFLLGTLPIIQNISYTYYGETLGWIIPLVYGQAFITSSYTYTAGPPDMLSVLSGSATFQYSSIAENDIVQVSTQDTSSLNMILCTNTTFSSCSYWTLTNSISDLPCICTPNFFADPTDLALFLYIDYSFTVPGPSISQTQNATLSLTQTLQNPPSIQYVITEMSSNKDTTGTVTISLDIDVPVTSFPPLFFIIGNIQSGDDITFELTFSNGLTFGVSDESGNNQLFPGDSSTTLTLQYTGSGWDTESS